MYNRQLKPIVYFKRKNSAILIFCIFSVQLTSSAILFNLSKITPSYFAWIILYYILTFFFAIPQSAFSDNYGRKKHLLIACLGVLISAIYLTIVYLFRESLFKSNSSILNFFAVFPICFFLGVTGNAIPIARAGIADLQIHDFRTAMGWATTIIGLGWITSVILGLLFSPLGTLIAVILLQFSIIVLINKFFIDSPGHAIKKFHGTQIFKVVSTSYKWLSSMFFVSGGSAAILAYLFAETTFYQIYSSNELEFANLSIKIIGTLMAIGYALGVILQWIISFSDKAGIKYGMTISLFTLLGLFFYNHLLMQNANGFFINNSIKIRGILEFFFAFGFGFSIPALFSLMSQKLQIHHFGKLFGIIDSTDTLALSLSFFIFFLKDKIVFLKNGNNTFSVLLFLISCIFYGMVIKKFVSYEEKN